MGGVVKTVERTVEAIIENPLPVIETIALTAIGVPPPVASAVVSAANGGDMGDIAKSYVGAELGGQVAGEVGGQVAGAVDPAVQQIIESATAGAVKSAVTGGDVGEGAVTGAVSSGIKKGIDYVGDQFAEPLGTGITPGAGGETGLTPRVPELPAAGDIGTTPVDYSFVPPSQTTAPGMGGAQGTGITATTLPEPPSPTEEFGKEAVKAGESLLTSALTRGVTDSIYGGSQPTSTSALTSTGLFQPVSIVPTSSTGIAPVARGAPILGGEDEEATGVWGRKTLRG